MDIGFSDNRLEEISENLRRINGEYALAVNIRNELWEKITPVITSEKGLTLDVSDFLDIKEYLEHVSTIAAIEKQASYRQGYADCISLLQELGILR